MYCDDFIFDGVQLSGMKCRLASFDGGGSENITAGNTLTLNTVTNVATGKTRLISTQYDEVFSITLQFVKMDCDDMNDYIFSETEVAHIMRWLNVKGYKKFKPIYEDLEYSDMYLMGTFTAINLVRYGNDVVGFECTFTTNAPYGYYEDKIFSKKGISSGDSFRLADVSDEVGYIYPTVTITAKSAGNLTITNSLDDKDNITIVNNVKAGEVITLNGITKIIKSSIAHSRLYNDFNYKFPRVVNTTISKENIYTIKGIGCDISITYAPICKALSI